MRLAVIPARGGSKRIPRKNIRDFCGKPMIAWSIEAAIASKCFDRIIVSTDDEEIAETAKAYGAEVPFMRPLELSDDFTGTTDVVLHAINWQNCNAAKVKDVCCIYATAPLLIPEYLQRGLKILTTSKADTAFSVTSYPFPIQRAIRITSNQRIAMYYPEHFFTRSQDLENAWHDAGQVYWGNANSWLSKKPISEQVQVPVILPRYRVQDIDTPEDWKVAELMFRILTNEGLSKALADDKGAT
jgi:N-acylneuraminate cytidylyltransferase